MPNRAFAKFPTMRQKKIFDGVIVGMDYFLRARKIYRGSFEIQWH